MILNNFIIIIIIFIIIHLYVTVKKQSMLQKIKWDHTWRYCAWMVTEQRPSSSLSSVKHGDLLVRARSSTGYLYKVITGPASRHYIPAAFGFHWGKQWHSLESSTELELSRYNFLGVGGWHRVGFRARGPGSLGSDMNSQFDQLPLLFQGSGSLGNVISLSVTWIHAQTHTYVILFTLTTVYLLVDSISASWCHHRTWSETFMLCKLAKLPLVIRSWCVGVHKHPA